MHRIGYDEPRVAINAAGKSMLAGARRKLAVPNIVHAHRHDVVAGFHRVGDVEGESGVTAPVFADAPAVHENFRHLKNAVKLQIDAPARPCRRHVEMFPIPAVADVKPVRGEIRHRERVRQIGGIPFGVVKRRRIRASNIAKLKFPFAVEIDGLPQVGSRRKICGTNHHECQQQHQYFCGPDCFLVGNTRCHVSFLGRG